MVVCGDGPVRDFSRNSAACTRLGGAVFRERRTCVWCPPVRVSGTLRRVARPTEHGAVADVEGRTAGRERHDVVDGQVAGSVGGALVARAPVAVLAAPGAEHAGAETLPDACAVQGVVAAAVGLPRVLGAAATRTACDDTTDRAELHGASRMRAGPCLTLVTLACTPFDIATSVIGEGGGVYSPRVLRLRSQAQVDGTCAGLKSVSGSSVEPRRHLQVTDDAVIDRPRCAHRGGWSRFGRLAAEVRCEPLDRASGRTRR